MRFLSLTSATTLVESSAAQDSMATSSPSVFAAEAPLQLTIRTDTRTLLRDRGENRRSHHERARPYYDDFYRLIDDPRRIRREMLGRCG